MGSSIITVIVVLALVVLFFYMLRSGILWYWKIDVMAKNLEEQTKVMKEQKDILQQMYLLQAIACRMDLLMYDALLSTFHIWL